MLGEYPIDVVLLATDLEASKDFYVNKIGLEILDESAYAIQFKCGGGSRLAISKSTVGRADSQTQAAWRLNDLAAELAVLLSRGVKIPEYDLFPFTTLQAVAQRPFRRMG